MKKKAKKSEDNPAIIVANAINVSTPVAARLPKPISMVRTVQRIQAQQHVQLPNPTSLADLEIPDPFKLTTKGENFLLHDSGGTSAERYLIYTTADNLNLLAQCPQWNFSLRPVYFSATLYPTRYQK